METFVFIFFLSFLLPFRSAHGQSLTVTASRLEERLERLETKLANLEMELSACHCKNSNYSNITTTVQQSSTVRETTLINLPTTTTESPKISKCNVGWELYNESCWRHIGDSSLNWTSAKAHCTKMGGNLASIHSSAENDFAMALTNVSAQNGSLESSTCFDKVPGKVLQGLAFDIVKPATLELCKFHCVESGANCSSFMYFNGNNECVLSSKSRLTNPNLFVNSSTEEGADYYEKVPCGNAETLADANRGKPKVSKCRSIPADVALLVDGSGSIGPSEFPKIKRFLQLVVNTAKDVGPDAVQFGMVQFSDDQWSEFAFNDYATASALKDAIDKVPYREGGTLIGQAIQFLLQNELTNPQRGRRPQYPSYVLIITDGFSQDNPSGPAEQLRSSGSTVITVGVSHEVSHRQLLNIAGGNENHVFIVNDFNSLNENLTRLISSELCLVAEDPPKGIWLGLSDEKIEKVFRWSDDSSGNFFNFAPNQPDDKDHNLNCVVALDNDNGTWDDVSCSSEYTFFCKLPLQRQNVA